MTRQQQWAMAALAKVTAAKDKGDPYPAKYRTACMKAPGLVQRAGALQALAFWMSRSDEEFRDFAEDVARTYANSSADALRRELAGAAMAGYLARSRDLAEVCLWFRRMAQAELPAPRKQGD